MNAPAMAVFGHPVAHSLSPRIHTLFGAQTDTAIRYAAIEAPVNGFARAVTDFIRSGGRGGQRNATVQGTSHAAG